VSVTPECILYRYSTNVVFSGAINICFERKAADILVEGGSAVSARVIILERELTHGGVRDGRDVELERFIANRSVSGAIYVKKHGERSNGRVRAADGVA